jgi:hypothetical protein
MIFRDRVKTVLSSKIVYDVVTMKKDPGIAVAYFYFDFNDTQKQNVDSMLKSIVLQLAQSLDNVPSNLNELYFLHEHGRQQPSIDKTLEAIYQTIQTCAQVYIVLDALDECSQPVELFQILGTMRQWHLHNSHVIVTRRRERDIESDLQKVGGHRNTVCFESEVVDGYIRQHVRQRLSNDKLLKKWGSDPILRDEIETAMIQGSQGMYAYYRRRIREALR